MMAVDDATAADDDDEDDDEDAEVLDVLVDMEVDNEGVEKAFKTINSHRVFRKINPRK